MKAHVMVESYMGIPAPSYAEVYHLVVPEAGNLCITFPARASPGSLGWDTEHAHATVSRECPERWKHLADVEISDELVRDAEAFLAAQTALERHRDAVATLLSPLPPPAWRL